MRSWGWLLGIILLATTATGCDAHQTDGNEGGGMFGIFGGGKKAGKTVTTVHPDVGATLVRQPVFPESAANLPSAQVGDCMPVAIEGRPPNAKFVETFVDGRTDSGYRIS